MAGTNLVVREAPAVGPGSRRYRLDCAHGSTSAVVLPGGSPLGEQIALQMLLLRHDRDNGCRCSRELRPEYAGVARA
ncbi:MAG: hypothetical protein A2X23_04520 [Chloroflexi bacterium GWC2_73_18]|nr:MAG: hypothetical protein A2X23_04520 [Chloroflexi bacterium GWC2_73_18]